MLYGQYPHASRCYENRFPMPTDGRPSFIAALTEAGYRTHGIGKCHFTPDPHALRGFETRQTQEEIVRSPGRDDYLKSLHDAGFAHVCDPHGARGEMYYVPQVAQMPAALHPTGWIGQQTIRFVEAQADSSQPWFCFSSYVHPHPPFAPPNPWHKLYRAGLMPLPNVPADAESLWIYINRRQNRYKYRDQGIDRNLVRCLKAHYYAAVSFIDFQVGRTIEALERTGQMDNTLIVFTSDHGELLGDYNCFGKRSMHDAASRVPLIARQAGRFEGGRRCGRVASLVDLAPTIVSAAGAAMPPAQLAGVDLADLAAGTCGREHVFSQHDRADSATYMAVGERWKYFYSAPDGREFLLDRLGDPRETRNRAGLRFCEDARRRLKDALIGHLCAGGEADALDGEDWRAYPPKRVPADPDAGLLIQDHPWADTRIPGYTEA
jgi:arylsulfatase A-like enzyme